MKYVRKKKLCKALNRRKKIFHQDNYSIFRNQQLWIRIIFEDHHNKNQEIKE